MPRYKQTMLVTGGSGILGTEIRNIYGDKYLYPSHSEFNIANYDGMVSYVEDLACHGILVHSILNCACAKDNDDYQGLFMTNIVGAFNVARVFRSLLSDYYNDDDFPRRRLIHISTDYVYSMHGQLHKETSREKPQSNYSKSKYFGEIIITDVLDPRDYLIVRTSFFPRKVAYEYGYVNKYTSGDFVDIIAPLIINAIDRGLHGTYNVGGKRISVYELLKQRKEDIKPAYYGDKTVTYDTSMDISKLEGTWKI